MMRTAFTFAFAGVAAAAMPADGTNTLAPGEAKSEELKQLLALDSFNVTSSDAEQNRMHAVCDMEYRLSKTRALGNKGLGISNLMIAGDTATQATATPAASPLMPFNPFSMPLLAVKAHIALLEQEKTYLQAQSDAFEGKSSTDAAAATPAAAFEISAVDYTAAGAFTVSTTPLAAASRGADSNIMISFKNLPKTAAGAEIVVTISMEDDSAVGTAATLTLEPSTGAIPGSTATNYPSACFNLGADAASASDDAVCQIVDASDAKIAFTAATVAAANKATLTATQDSAAVVATVPGGGSTLISIFTFAATSKKLSFKYTLPSTHYLDAVASGKWMLGGVWSTLVDPASIIKHKITMEVVEAGAIVHSASKAAEVVGSR